MIRSMTGFGLAELETDGLSVRVEIRAVNHRFLQVRQRVPVELCEIEPKLEGLLRKSLSRGAVNLNVNLVRTGAAGAIDLDLEAAQRYRDLLARAAKELGVENDVGLSRLTELPGVVAQRVDSAGREREMDLALNATRTAVAFLVEMREAEGARLEEDLRKHTTEIARLCVLIGGRMPEVVRAHHAALRKRVDELAGEFDVAPEDLARELALIADKSDVSEELARLEAHLEALDESLAKGGAVGRQLDFLVQELHREANTIGSKASDAQVAHAVVELKTSIERVREQVQNVE